VRSSATVSSSTVEGNNDRAEEFDVILDAVRPIAVAATIVALLAMILYLVARAFAEEPSTGVRSIAGALLPLLAVTYLSIRHEQKLEYIEVVPRPLAFAVSLLLGVLLVSRLSDGSSGAPTNELLASGCFSFLLFCRRSVSRDRSMSFFFGILLGALGFVALSGPPDFPAWPEDAPTAEAPVELPPDFVPVTEPGATP
jgi:hypothetical protein